MTIRRRAIHGYKFGTFIQGANFAVNIIGTDVSGNRNQKLLSTVTHYDERDRAGIFHLDSWESCGA